MSAAHTLVAADPALFNPETGRLNAARIARDMNVPVAMIAEAIGRKAPGSASIRMPAVSRVNSVISIGYGRAPWRCMRATRSMRASS